MSNASYICLNLRDICNSDVFYNYTSSPKVVKILKLKLFLCFFNLHPLLYIYSNTIFSRASNYPLLLGLDVSIYLSTRDWSNYCHTQAQLELDTLWYFANIFRRTSWLLSWKSTGIIVAIKSKSKWGSNIANFFVLRFLSILEG